MKKKQVKTKKERKRKKTNKKEFVLPPNCNYFGC